MRSSDALSPPDRDALLRRIGLPASEPPSAGFLNAVQRAWCLTQPFHNLDLLAARTRGSGPLGPREAIQRCIHGLGGPCHVQSSAFCALIQSLGFDAGLCGATIGQADDHLLVRVTVAGALYYCDVGNGQPYLEPFPAATSHRQEHLGWVVISTPDEDGMVVDRRSPDQPERRRVYRASPAPRLWSHFFDAIRRHHEEPGFGPFLRGLRAVRIGVDEMVTLRDLTVTRYRRDGYDQFPLAASEVAAYLRDVFALAELPVDDALRAWAP